MVDGEGKKPGKGRSERGERCESEALRRCKREFVVEIEKREESSRFKRAGQIRFGEFRDKALSGSELSRAVGCLPRPRCSFFPVAVVLFRRIISPTLS